MTLNRTELIKISGRHRPSSIMQRHWEAYTKDMIPIRIMLASVYVYTVVFLSFRHVAMRVAEIGLDKFLKGITMETTTVNAGFRRKIGRKFQWKNVQRIIIPMPCIQIGSKEFRALVNQSQPEGEGWMLQGYCPSDN